MQRRRGEQILNREEEDAKPLARCEKKRKEWAKHWQCGKEVQDQKNKPWRNVELKKLEEDMPKCKESDLAKAAKTHKRDGSRVRWLSPQSSAGCRPERQDWKMHWWKFLEKGGAVWEDVTATKLATTHCSS